MTICLYELEQVKAHTHTHINASASVPKSCKKGEISLNTTAAYPFDYSHHQQDTMNAQPQPTLLRETRRSLQTLSRGETGGSQSREKAPCLASSTEVDRIRSGV